ncbi:unnamed protein product [Sphenostylis stenocarpa]|uniref:Uncharacterized protein n=1 Tax=Sphenostylis stenocarpa TaxID=92480 RepID=A0AA86VEW5_9FABA|nr:unnamed protein product [Sphenostylis stenocarpa]
MARMKITMTLVSRRGFVCKLFKLLAKEDVTNQKLSKHDHKSSRVAWHKIANHAPYG